MAANCSRVTVLALDGLTEKHFGHYTLLKLFPSDHQVLLFLAKIEEAYFISLCSSEIFSTFRASYHQKRSERESLDLEVDLSTCQKVLV